MHKQLILGKRMIITMLCICLTFMGAVPTFAAAEDMQIEMRDTEGKTVSTLYVGNKYDLEIENKPVDYKKKYECRVSSNPRQADREGEYYIPVAPGTFKVSIIKESTKQVYMSKTYTVLQRATSVTTDDSELYLDIGDTATIKATIKPAKSTDVVRFYSEDETIATVEEKSGKVTAVANGECTIKVVSKDRDDPKEDSEEDSEEDPTEATDNSSKNNNIVTTVKVFVGPYMEQVIQKSVTELDITFKAPVNVESSKLVITNDTTKEIYPVKSVSIDEENKKLVHVETSTELRNGGRYTVQYEQTSAQFTAIYGQVAKLQIVPTQIVCGEEKPIYIQLVDANGVILGSYTRSNAPTNISFDKFEISGGSQVGDNIIFDNKDGNCTVHVTYHTNKYENDQEVGNIELEQTINATEVPPTVDSIAVKTSPIKTTYTVGEILDLTGGKITVTKSDNSTEEIAITSEMVIGFDNTTAGTKTITVTYEEKTATFTVTVNEAHIHTYSEEWSSDETNHWHGATCEHITEVKDKAAHTFGNYVSNNNGTKTRTCTVCGYKETVIDEGFNPQITTSCVLHFDSQGGSQVNDLTVEQGKTANLPIPTKPSYGFTGWFTGTFGTGTQYTNSTIITTSATLYANWQLNDTPSYTPNGTLNDTPSGSTSSSSSSGSSNSSSSSETPKTEVSKTQPVIVDGKKLDIGNQKVSSGETNFTLDQKQFTSYIEKAEVGSEAIIPITANTDKVKAGLNLQNIKDMSDKSISLKVENQKVTYAIPSNAIDISAVANGLGVSNLKDISVEIILEKTDKGAIKQVKSTMEAQKGEIIGTPMKFEIKASADGKEVKIESFNTYVKNSLEVSEKEAKEITTAVIILPDGSMRHVPTKLNNKDGKQIVDISSKTNGTYVLVKSNVSYSDAKGKWYERVANELGSRMITKCLDKANTNTIQGEKDITREEFAALLVNALGLPQTSNAAAHFSDIADSNYTDEIGAAYEYGIINGLTQTTFAPNKTITRQEEMVMLQRAAKIAELTSQGGNAVSFKDASKVSNWAQDAVAFNVENGLIVGSNGQIKPQDTITRAESMVAILRLLQKSNLIDVKVEV